MQVLLDSETYDRLIEALATVPASFDDGRPDRCAIKIALGEVADVWPERIAGILAAPAIS